MKNTITKIKILPGFRKFYFPTLIGQLIIGIILTLISIMIILYDDRILGFVLLTLSILIFGIIYIECLYWDIKDWNKLELSNNKLTSYSLRGKELCSVDFNKPIYYSNVCIPGHGIIHMKIVYIISNSYISMDNVPNVKPHPLLPINGMPYRYAFDNQTQILIFENKKIWNALPKDSWIYIEKNDNYNWL